MTQTKDANFSSMADLSQADLSKSSNPWVQAHLSMSCIDKSQRDLLKEDEARQKKLRQEWKKDMGDTSTHYDKTANSQKWWRNASGAVTSLSFALPWAGLPAGQLACSFDAVQKMGFSAQMVEGYCKMGAEALKQSGTQFVSEASQVAQMAAKVDQTALEWRSGQSRQDLDQQGQAVQETRSAKTAFNERVYEIIKTLAQVLNSHH